MVVAKSVQHGVVDMSGYTYIYIYMYLGKFNHDLTVLPNPENDG